jgi:uncharacterized protein (UPF0332 family)
MGSVTPKLDEKARENLEAVERLLATGDRPALPLCNAAASRAYYSAYLAVADRALRDGRGFDSTKADYYRHDTLPENAMRWSILDEDLRDDLSWLRDLRVKADYWEDQVSYDEVSEAATVAERFIGLLEATS